MLSFQLLHQDMQRGILISSIAELRKEAAKNNTPATYAKCAKCQRQINANEKALAALEAADGSKQAWHNRVLKATNAIKVGRKPCMTEESLPSKA